MVNGSSPSPDSSLPHILASQPSHDVGGGPEDSSESFRRQNSSGGAGPSGPPSEDFTLVSLLSREEAQQLQEKEMRLQLIVAKLQDPNAKDNAGQLLSDADRTLLRIMGVEVIDGMSALVRRKLKWLEDEGEGDSAGEGQSLRPALLATAGSAAAAVLLFTAIRLVRRWRCRRRDAAQRAAAKAPAGREGPTA